MNKRQLIEAICKRNVTADVAFLIRFTEVELAAYLARLEAADKKDQLIAGWVRPNTNMRLAG